MTGGVRAESAPALSSMGREDAGANAGAGRLGAEQASKRAQHDRFLRGGRRGAAPPRPGARGRGDAPQGAALPVYSLSS